MLVEEGYSVVALDRNNNLSLLQRLNPSVICIKTDVSEKGSWQDEFKDADCVIQLHAQIASTSSEPFVKSNVDGVKNVLEACKKYKIKNLVHISSSVVISVANDDYTRTKRAGEELVKNGGIPFTILRPPLMFGCFDSKHLGWITRLMEKFPIIPVPGSGKYLRQTLYVNDLCKIILELTRRNPENKTWNVIGKEKIYYIDLLRKIVHARGWKKWFVKMPLPLFGLMLRAYSLITGKPMFTKDQMNALVAGDLFPVENWCEEFNVEYTPFDKAIWETWHCENSKYAKEMESPH